MGYSLLRCDLRLHVEYKYTNKYTIQRPCKLSVFSRYFVPTSFSWNSVHSVMRLLVFQYSYHSLLFPKTIDKLQSRFLDLLLKSSFVCVSESWDVSCWGCNANSTFGFRFRLRFWVYVLGLSFGFKFRALDHVTRTLRWSKCIALATWPIQAVGLS